MNPTEHDEQAADDARAEEASRTFADGGFPRPIEASTPLQGSEPARNPLAGQPFPRPGSAPDALVYDPHGAIPFPKPGTEAYRAAVEAQRTDTAPPSAEPLNAGDVRPPAAAGSTRAELGALADLLRDNPQASPRELDAIEYVIRIASADDYADQLKVAEARRFLKTLRDGVHRA